MAIAHLAMHALELLFFTGMLGSAIVIIISFVEDAKELGGGND